MAIILNTIDNSTEIYTLPQQSNTTLTTLTRTTTLASSSTSTTTTTTYSRSSSTSDATTATETSSTATEATTNEQTSTVTSTSSVTTPATTTTQMKNNYTQSCSSELDCDDSKSLYCALVSSGCNCPDLSNSNMCDCKRGFFYDKVADKCGT